MKKEHEGGVRNLMRYQSAEPVYLKMGFSHEMCKASLILS